MMTDRAKWTCNATYYLFVRTSRAVSLGANQKSIDFGTVSRLRG